MDWDYKDEPARVDQLTAALGALGVYAGEGTAAEYAAEAERLGADAYRMHLVNCLLGAVQLEAILCEGLADGDAEQLQAAHDEQLRSGGVMDPATGEPDPGKLVEFLRWQTLRVNGPLRNVVQDPTTGPIPLAAAHAADGLYRLLGVIAGGQVPDIDNVQHGLAEMRQARRSLESAISNLDILLDMLTGLHDITDN